MNTKTLQPNLSNLFVVSFKSDNSHFDYLVETSSVMDSKSFLRQVAKIESFKCHFYCLDKRDYSNIRSWMKHPSDWCLKVLDELVKFRWIMLNDNTNIK